MESTPTILYGKNYPGAATRDKQKGIKNMSRIIGRNIVNGKDICVNQHQEHSDETHDYVIKDTEKRELYEKEKQNAEEKGE